MHTCHSSRLWTQIPSVSESCPDPWDDEFLQAKPRDTRTTVMLRNLPNNYTWGAQAEALRRICVRTRIYGIFNTFFCIFLSILGQDMSWAGEPGHVPCPVVRSKAGLGYAFVNLCDPSFAGVLRSFELREFGHMATLEWIRSENSGSQEIFQQKSQHFPIWSRNVYRTPGKDGRFRPPRCNNFGRLSTALPNGCAAAQSGRVLLDLHGCKISS